MTSVSQVSEAGNASVIQQDSQAKRILQITMIVSLILAVTGLCLSVAFNFSHAYSMSVGEFTHVLPHTTCCLVPIVLAGSGVLFMLIGVTAGARLLESRRSDQAPLIPVNQAPQLPSITEHVAELSGKICSLNVQVGDVIEAGTTLYTVESMKMTMPIITEVRGRVVEILVEKDSVIEQNQPIIRIQEL